MERNIFELASRQVLRYTSPRGELTTEQLWDLPLLARNGFDLDTVARSVAKELKDLGEESFVETKANPAKDKAELKLEVLKHIIAIKQADKLAAEQKIERAAQRKRLEEALANKQEAALAGLSEDEIKAQLQALKD